MRIDTFSTFNEFFEDFNQQFTKELGSEKVNSIAKNVINSNGLNKLIQSCLQRRSLPIGKNIIEAVSGSRSFIFSSSKVILVASIVELAIIINNCGEAGIMFSHESMLQVAKQIFLEVKQIS